MFIRNKQSESAQIRVGGIGAHVLQIAAKRVNQAVLKCAAGGMFFTIFFGYLTTKKVGTTSAMIALGIGKLVASCSRRTSECCGVTVKKLLASSILLKSREA